MSANAAIFQPIVSVVDGVIDVDWFDSFIWVVDAGGSEVDDNEAEQSGTDALDTRLAEIRALLGVDESPLAQLVRPFFAVREDGVAS